MRYREVFKPARNAPDAPGRVFYTIAPEDVGRRTAIKLENGLHVDIPGTLGYVQEQDVGKRVYRTQHADPAAGWFWQSENNEQRDARLAREPR